MTTQSITFRSIETWRGSRDGELGGGRLVRTEVVHANGHVDVRVVGRTDDDGHVDQRATREHGPLDLERVRATRLASGWSVVE
jgi:hypothetical protein